MHLMQIWLILQSEQKQHWALISQRAREQEPQVDSDSHF